MLEPGRLNSRNTSLLWHPDTLRILTCGATHANGLEDYFTD